MAVLATSCLGAIKAYDANEEFDNQLIMENIEALASTGESGQMVTVRAARLKESCYRQNVTTAKCKRRDDCIVTQETWEKDHDLFRTFDMPVERYREEIKWAAAQPQDTKCNGLRSTEKPKSSTSHSVCIIN